MLQSCRPSAITTEEDILALMSTDFSLLVQLSTRYAGAFTSANCNLLSHCVLRIHVIGHACT